MMPAQLIQERSHQETKPGLRQMAFQPTTKLGGYTTLAGTLIGAALWGTSGTDLWTALDTGDVAGYLAASASSSCPSAWAMLATSVVLLRRAKVTA